MKLLSFTNYRKIKLELDFKLVKFFFFFLKMLKVLKNDNKIDKSRVPSMRNKAKKHKTNPPVFKILVKR